MLNSYYRKKSVEYLNYFTHTDNSVLEIGAKDGFFIKNINGKNKRAICFSSSDYETCKIKYPTINFTLHDQNKINITEKYDLIFFMYSIIGLEDIQKTLEQLHSACHPHTKIIICHYNYFLTPLVRFAEIIGIKPSPKATTINRLTDDEVSNLLELSGYSVYRYSKRILLPIYIPVISWLFNTILSNFPIFHYFQFNNYTFAKYVTPVYDYSVSVVIPARNESGNIENAITRLPKLGKHTEIIFIEGNSTDDTWDKIQEIQKKYSGSHDIKIGKQKGKGKADAVREGFGIATGDILMILDADLTVPPEDLTKFYNALASGKGDFINGSRLVYPMEKGAMRFLNLLGNQFFSKAFTLLLEQKFKDTLCGTKVILREDYYKLVKNQKYFGDFDPFGDFDLIFGAHKLNLKIVEIPIRYRDRTYGSTNISRFKHGLILLRMVFFAMRKIKFIQ